MFVPQFRTLPFSRFELPYPLLAFAYNNQICEIPFEYHIGRMIVDSNFYKELQNVEKVEICFTYRYIGLDKNGEYVKKDFDIKKGVFTEILNQGYCIFQIQLDPTFCLLLHTSHYSEGEKECHGMEPILR